MRSAVACVLALTMFASASLAAETGALPQGTPAGIGQAQKSGSGNAFYVVAGGLTLLGLGALLISAQQSATSSISFSSNDNTVIPVNNTNIIVTTTTST